MSQGYAIYVDHKETAYVNIACRTNLEVFS